MAAEKEEIILEFQVEQGSAITELERTKKSILGIKQEQQELQKAYKKGNITLDEYAKETVRLEGIMKRQQSTYLNVQKSVTGVKTQMDKLIESNKNISKSFQNTSESMKGAVGQLNIGGQSVESLGTKIASLANPVTAAVAGITALSALYANSTIGAKDLAFAHNQLSAAVNLASNSFASMISSSEDGEGIFSKALTAIIFHLDSTTGIQAKLIAQAKEDLEDLGRTEIQVRANVSDRIEENQELLTKIGDEQEKYNNKIGYAYQIELNLKKNKEELVGVLNQELAQLESILSFDKENEDLQTSVLQKKREIAKAEADTEKRIQGIIRLTENLTAAEDKRAAAKRKRLSQGFSTQESEVDLSGVDLNGGQDSQAKEQDKLLADLFKTNAAAYNADQQAQADANEEKKKDLASYTQFVKEQKKLEAQAYADVLYAISNVFDQGSALQKGFALTSIAVDTGEAIAALTAASEQNPANGFTFGAAGIAQYAGGIIRILSNIAAAKQYLGYASGGYTGHGDKYEPAGIVHRGEVVFNQEDVSALGGPSIVNRMRPTYPKASLQGGYYDGGIATGQQQIDAALASANAIKNMPPPVVSAQEITKAQNRVKVAENISKA
jgi:hypothetical protein